jgi:hypothetical protein
MTALPQLLIDNAMIYNSNTITIRGNTVRDITCDNDDVKGIEVVWPQNARVKENKVYRIASRSSSSYGFTVEGCNDLLLFYNAASRLDTGFKFNSITALNVYNATAHNCRCGVNTSSSGTFRNIALSAYFHTKYYKQAIGFTVNAGTVDLDYAYHFNLAQLANGIGNVTVGGVVLEKEILYLDEPGDDLTPDHISELVKIGTTDPSGVAQPDIGGVASEVTLSQTTPNRKYQYDLIDNSFWYIEYDKAVEVSFIKAMQSRILANAELANTEVINNVYLKDANGVSRFTELYPMYARYCNADRFQKRVMDVWYAGQNCGTTQAYQNGIGGYNLLPTFLRHLLDRDGCWVVNKSFIDYDNYLLGSAEQKFGIGLDVLGISTLTIATSAECYRNVMNSIADVGPVEWTLHEEVEPTGYAIFADMYNGFSNCTLTNMVYSDNYAVIPKEIDQTCEVLTPAIPLTGISTLTLGATGVVEDYEFSLLDRTYSQNVTRAIYYRTGNALGSMSAWTTASKAVGQVVSTDKVYIQFKLIVTGILRIIDYEFNGIAIRHYVISRDWNS